MGELDEVLYRYRQTALLLPDRLRQGMISLSDQEKSVTEEVRLRSQRPMMISLPGEEKIFQSLCPTEGELLRILEAATKCSYHAAQSSLREGFFTLPGGNRMGLCGTAVIQNGEVSFLKEPSSLVIRMAHQKRGAAEEIYREIEHKGKWKNMLILSPPGVGKTTLLRDLVRLLSDRGKKRIALIDERSEVAALHHGVPQLDVGLRTDVLEGCPKGQAIPMVLRAMAPEIIALDEITEEEDLVAMRMAAYCGAGLLATAHAETPEDLRRRPLYRKLLDEKIFSYLVLLERVGTERRFIWEELESCCGC